MADQNENLLHGEQDTVMIYFNPELIQTLADRSAEKRQNFRELLSAAEDGDLDAGLVITDPIGEVFAQL